MKNVLDGILVGRILGKKVKESDFELDYKAVAITGGVCVCFLGALIGATAYCGKMVTESKNNLDIKIAETLNYKYVDVSRFNWYTEGNEKYILDFAGSAITKNDEDIDFFTCQYNISENQYYDISSYIRRNDSTIFNDKILLDKLIVTLDDAELLSHEEKKNIPVDKSKTILSVSDAGKYDDEMSYYVCLGNVEGDELVSEINKVNYTCGMQKDNIASQSNVSVTKILQHNTKLVSNEVNKSK